MDFETASFVRRGQNLDPALATSVYIATRVTKRCAARFYALSLQA